MPDVVRNFVTAARVCRIATARPNGEPHAIPVCPVFDGDATIYVDIGRRYATAEGLQENDRVAVLVDEYFDDWSKLKAFSFAAGHNRSLVANGTAPGR